MTTIATSVLRAVPNTKGPRRGKAADCSSHRQGRRGCQLSLSRSPSLFQTSNRGLCKSELVFKQQITSPDKSEPPRVGSIILQEDCRELYFLAFLHPLPLAALSHLEATSHSATEAQDSPKQLFLLVRDEISVITQKIASVYRPSELC